MMETRVYNELNIIIFVCAITSIKQRLEKENLLSSIQSFPSSVDPKVLILNQILIFRYYK